MGCLQSSCTFSILVGMLQPECDYSYKLPALESSFPCVSTLLCITCKTLLQLTDPLAPFLCGDQHESYEYELMLHICSSSATAVRDPLLNEILQCAASIYAKACKQKTVSKPDELPEYKKISPQSGIQMQLSLCSGSSSCRCAAL